MTYTEKLISFHIIERENNKNFHTWTYPTITDDHKNYILQKCFCRNDTLRYTCRRNSNTWFYICEVSEKSFAVVILAKEFEPNKYKVLCDILAKKYSETRNPVDLVALYLNLYTSGGLHDNGTLFAGFKKFECATNIKELIRSFDVEIILLYNAILLKRRVVAFRGSPSGLLDDLWAIAHLVPCRKVEEYLHPVVENLSQLKGLSFFVAGTTDREFAKHEHLYDIFVDLDSKEIKISPKAEEIMGMTKTHKEIATFLVKLSTSDSSEAEINVQILQKTKELIHILQNLASVTTENNTKMITINELKSKKFHPNLENFLFNLALAENMMIL
ncbi:DENN domain-containing protein 10-like [Zophobas morio]|uniref:DENN domain-containing protein 10-like n=1 Tax=Zophobas morio TaxID=2755281 RepID=UPI003082E39B